MTPGYAEIAVTSNFSFLRGASRPEELSAQACLHGYAAIGIADRNTLAGVVRAHAGFDNAELPERKPKFLVGARLVFSDGTPDILAYPIDRGAYGNLCRLLTIGKLRAKKGECTLYMSDLLEWQDRLLLAVMPPARGGFAKVREALEKLRGAAPDRTWLAASMLHRGDDRRRLNRLKALANDARVPLRAVNDVLYHVPERRELQDVVTCIREHVTIDKAGKLLEANAERHLKAPEEMARLFADAPEAITQTVRFAQRITFSLAELKYNYPEEPIPPGKTPDEYLHELTWAGGNKRYPDGVPDSVRATLEKELALIKKLD
jgi:error-prone DNA polymerase